ncbi:MAG: hypothetical protein ACE14O_03340 [Candidatus Cloacimonadaceae bacterium]
MSFKLFSRTVAVFSFICIILQVSAIETKLSGEMWGRWTNETTKNKDADGEYRNKISKNYLSLERGYLGLETAFTANTKARFTVDMFSTDATYQYPSDSAMPIDTLKNSTIDGAGLKLKYGYVDFANLFPIPDLNLTVGLQKTYFGTIYDWNYALIEKAPSDLYKVANSSDYGITLNGFIPQGWGEYALGIYNGEGYKKIGSALSDNIDFAYLVNFRVTPISGFSVGGSYMNNTVGREKTLSGDALNSKYEEQNLWDGLGRFVYGPVEVWLEYIYKDVAYPNVSGKDYTATGLTIMPVITLKPLINLPVEVIGRYDRWDESDRPSADTAKSLLNTMIFGLNYNFMPDNTNTPQMTVQLNYETKMYDEDKSAPSFADGKKDSSQLMLQLKWKFANTL